MRNCGKEGWRGDIRVNGGLGMGKEGWRGDSRVYGGLGMGKEGWRGDSRVYGGLGMGSGAKAHPDQYFSKKSFVKIF